MTRISLWPAGSPPVTKKMMANMLKVQMVPEQYDGGADRAQARQGDVEEVLPPAGAVHLGGLVEARGMDCSPPSSESIMNGTPHQVFTMIAANL